MVLQILAVTLIRPKSSPRGDPAEPSQCCIVIFFGLFFSQLAGLDTSLLPLLIVRAIFLSLLARTCI